MLDNPRYGRNAGLGPGFAVTTALLGSLLAGGCDSRQEFEIGRTELTEEATPGGSRLTVRTQIRPDDSDDFRERVVVTDVTNYRDGGRHVETRTVNEHGQELSYVEDPSTRTATIRVSGQAPVELTEGRDGLVYYERQAYDKSAASYREIGESAAHKVRKVDRTSVVAMGVAERTMRPRLAEGQKLAVFNVFVDIITTITDALDINTQIGQGNTSSQGSG